MKKIALLIGGGGGVRVTPPLEFRPCRVMTYSKQTTTACCENAFPRLFET